MTAKPSSAASSARTLWSAPHLATPRLQFHCRTVSGGRAVTPIIEADAGHAPAPPHTTHTASMLKYAHCTDVMHYSYCNLCLWCRLGLASSTSSPNSLRRKGCVAIFIPPRLGRAGKMPSPSVLTCWLVAASPGFPPHFVPHCHGAAVDPLPRCLTLTPTLTLTLTHSLGAPCIQRDATPSSF